MKNKRKTYLIKPKMQLKVILSMVIAAALTTTAISWMTYSALDQNENVTFAASEMLQNYRQHLRIVVISLCGLIVTSSMAMLFFGVYLTQKIAGPLVPIERMVRELINGNYGIDDIRLRKGDELQELAEQLNELKKSLQLKNGTNTESSVS